MVPKNSALNGQVVVRSSSIRIEFLILFESLPEQVGTAKEVRELNKNRMKLTQNVDIMRGSSKNGQKGIARLCRRMKNGVAIRK